MKEFTIQLFKSEHNSNYILCIIDFYRESGFLKNLVSDETRSLLIIECNSDTQFYHLAIDSYNVCKNNL